MTRCRRVAGQPNSSTHWIPTSRAPGVDTPMSPKARCQATSGSQSSATQMSNVVGVCENATMALSGQGRSVEGDIQSVESMMSRSIIQTSAATTTVRSSAAPIARRRLDGRVMSRWFCVKPVLVAWPSGC